MSLLNGLEKALLNPIYEDIMESEVDLEMDFEFALEAIIDKKIELSDEDVSAILDDDNPDNIAADLGRKDESIDNIANDSIDDDMKSLEALLEELENLDIVEESSNDRPEEDRSENDPDSLESELDDIEEDEVEDERISLDALLKSIF